MGQGVPFDDLAKRRFIAVIRRRPGRQHAAEQIGMTWRTVKKHLAEDADFAAAVDEAENLMFELIENEVFDQALDGNLAAAKEVLHNFRSHRWKDQQVLRHEISGPGGGPILVAQGLSQGLRDALTTTTSRESMVAMIADIPTTAELDAEVVDAEVVEDDEDG